jgi:hypothetical protein
VIFQINGQGWPVNGGALLVPAGTLLDHADWQFLGTPLPWPPPNVIARDQEAYDELLNHYPAWTIITGNTSIVRHGDPQP